MEINIDVTSWLDEYMQEEVDVSNLEALIDRATQDDMSARQLARLVIVARERGELEDDDLLPENKALLNTGAGLAVNMMMSQQTKRIETGSGKTYEVRTLIAPVSQAMSETQNGDASQADDKAHAERAQTLSSKAGVTPEMQPTPPDIPYLATLGSPEALRRAELYLERRVPGYIVGRLLVIRESGGDVYEAGEILKSKIDEMVEELAKPSQKGCDTQY